MGEKPTNAGNGEKRREIDRNAEGVAGDRRTFLKAAGAATAGLVAPIGTVGGRQDGPLTFGAIYLLSGFASVYGDSAQRGIRMAVDEINRNGGIGGREIGNVIFRDSEGSPSTGVQQARSLVQEENVVGLIGLDSSGVAQQIAPVMRQLRRPLMITHAATPYVTAMEGPNAAGNEYVFRDGVNLSQNLFGAATVARDLDATNWTTIGPDYAFGQETWDYFKAYTRGMNLGFNYMEDATAFPQLGASDFTPQINKVNDAAPDAVITSLWGSDLITFLNQAQGTDFFDNVDHLLMTVGAATDVLGPMGSNMPDGLWAGTRYWFEVPDTDVNRTFVRDYRRRNDGRRPSYNAQNAYTGMYLYKRAIEEAGGTDPNGITSAWEGMEHTAPVGTFTINPESHQAVLPAVWGRTSYSQEEGISLLDPVERIPAPPDRLRSLLSGTDLPAGV